MDRDSNKQQSSTQRFDCPVNAADTKWLLTGLPESVNIFKASANEGLYQSENYPAEKKHLL